MVEHTVKAFDSEISQLRGLIAEMGGLAEVAIREAVDALSRHDEEKAAGRAGGGSRPAGRADHRAARADGGRLA
jgi:phosphate uptake regulator